MRTGSICRARRSGRISAWASRLPMNRELTRRGFLVRAKALGRGARCSPRRSQRECQVLQTVSIYIAKGVGLEGGRRRRQRLTTCSLAPVRRSWSRPRAVGRAFATQIEQAISPVSRRLGSGSRKVTTHVLYMDMVRFVNSGSRRLSGRVLRVPARERAHREVPGTITASDFGLTGAFVAGADRASSDPDRRCAGTERSSLNNLLLPYNTPQRRHRARARQRAGRCLHRAGGRVGIGDPGA
jgi:hypothetical protein